MKLIIIIIVAIWIVFQVVKYIKIAFSEPPKPWEIQDRYSIPLDLPMLKESLEHKSEIELWKLRQEFINRLKKTKNDEKVARYHFFINAIAAIDKKIASLKTTKKHS